MHASQVQGNQTDFPVLIDITDADLQANVQHPNGYDIIFASDQDGNNILDHQIELYNSGNGHLVAWVRVPTLSGTVDTPIYMFYGNANVSSGPSTTSTWASSYRSVYHLNSDEDDATANARHGTNRESFNAVGKFADGQSFDGTNDYIALDDSYNSTGNNAMTVSAWVRTAEADNQVIFSYDRNAYWRLEVNGGAGAGLPAWRLQTASDGVNDMGAVTRIDDNSWHYLVGVFDNGISTIYIDGTANNSTSLGSTFGSGDTRFGFLGVGSETISFDGDKGPNNYWNGFLDEARIANTARSAGWIQTEFNS